MDKVILVAIAFVLTVVVNAVIAIPFSLIMWCVLDNLVKSSVSFDIAYCVTFLLNIYTKQVTFDLKGW